MSNNIAYTPSSTERYSSGIGHIVVLSEELMSREKYIVDCYKNSCVSIYIEGEGVHHRVNCSPDTFNWIYFPEDYKKVGTTIVWVFDKLKGLMYVVSSLVGGSNFETAKEHDFRFIRRFDDNFVEIVGNPKSKKLDISVHSDKGSELNIFVTDKEREAKFNIHVNGDIKVKAKQSMRFLSQEDFVIEVENENWVDEKSILQVTPGSIGHETSNMSTVVWERKVTKVANKTESLRTKNTIIEELPEEMSIKTDKLKLNTGKEKMVLGDSLSRFLEEFVIEVSNAEVVTPMGRMPLHNKREIMSHVMKLRKLFSRHGYLS